MNTIRNVVVRVRDHTEPQPIQRKRIQTLSDGPGLFFALGGLGTDSGHGTASKTLPRFRNPDQVEDMPTED